MTGGQASPAASDAERLEAIAFLVQTLIIGQWARSANPIARARADVQRAGVQLARSDANLSSGAHGEVTRILTGALGRLEAEIASSADRD